MNTAIIKTVYSILLFFLFSYCNTESLIIVPIRYELSLEHTYKLLLEPKKQAYLILKKIGSRSPVAGILATYAGYISASDNNGEIIFPKYQQETPLYLAITPTIIPIMRFDTTVDHWEFSTKEPISFFRIDITSNNKAGLNVTISEESVPSDHIVPYPTITIFSKPKHFDVPIGSFESHTIDHWILPSLVLKKDILLEKNSVLTLPFIQLFEPIHTMVKKEPKRKMIRIQN